MKKNNVLGTDILLVCSSFSAIADQTAWELPFMGHFVTQTYKVLNCGYFFN